MNIKLSVCIPTYNRVSELQKTIDSILPQIEKNPEIELVISDNASTDSTESMIAERQKLFRKIRYFKNSKNEEFDGNIISCIKRASGEYIIFFADDDIALPGTFERVKDVISKYNPAIICLSHYAFEGEDYLIKRRVFYPNCDKIYTSGKEFFLFAGLGFLSGLVLKAEYAKKYLQSVRMGKACAHLDIAARIALRDEGPFVFLGTCPVAARTPLKQSASYDLMRYGFIYVNQLYHELLREGLLSREMVYNREKSLLKSLIPKHIVNQIVLGNYKRIYSQRELIKSEFGRHWQFYFFVYPIFFIPRQMVIMPYKFLQKLMKFLKYHRYN